MKKIAIVTDTSVYLDEKFKDKHKDLKIIPIPLILKNEKTIYYENEISEDEYEKLIKSGDVKTSQIPVGVLEKKWDEYLNDYDFLIVAVMSKKLSSMHYSVLKLAKEKKYNKKVYVVDTEAVSIVLQREIEFLLDYIQKEEINNFNDLKGIDKEIKRIKKIYQFLLFPKSLETLKNGGRITKAAAMLSNLLKIYPILTLRGGKVDKYGVMNNYIKGIRKQLVFAVDNYKITEIQILTTKFDDQTVTLDFDEMLKEFNFKKITYIKIPGVILAHLGYNTIGFNFWMDKQ